jgi:hypothetical protein
MIMMKNIMIIIKISLQVRYGSVGPVMAPWDRSRESSAGSSPISQEFVVGGPISPN